MSQPLGELRSREVFNLPDGVTKRVRFGGVRVLDMSTGQEVFLTGPVDLMRYHTIMFSFVSSRTGQPASRDGFALKVVEEDGQVVDKDWNLIARRGQQQLTADLETGIYTSILYEIMGVGAPPDTRYSIRRLPP